MEQIIIIVGVFVVGFVAGWKGRESFATWRVKHMMLDYEEKLDSVKESLIPITIEKHSNEYYVYDAKGQFLVQADSRESLESALMEKYPGKLFATTPENLKEVGFD
jgi:hypothetical protein